MNKRKFLKVATYATGSLVLHKKGVAAASTSTSDRRIEDSNVTFQWRHENGRLFGNLIAPTRGWIAVGFNSRQSLKGTRFIVAAVSSAPVRVEEHIAIVPGHSKVESLGGIPAAELIAGAFRDGYSHLDFSLPHVFPDRKDLRLSPGSSSYLMLAWSRMAQFDHHSAWRKHYEIIL